MQRDIYGVLVILFALAFGPAVIVLQVMKIIEVNLPKQLYHINANLYY